MTKYTDVEINFMAAKLVNVLQKLDDDSKRGYLSADSCKDYLDVGQKDFQRVVVRVVERGHNILWNDRGYFIGGDGAAGKMFVALHYMKEGMEKYMDKILEASAVNPDTFPAVVSIIEDGTEKSMKQLQAGKERRWSGTIKGLLESGE